MVSQLGNIAARMRARPPAGVMRAVARVRATAGGEPIRITPDDLAPRRGPLRRERRALERAVKRSAR